MKKIRTNKRKIIKELQDEKESKRNITFSFPAPLIAQFKAECQENGFTMNQVIEKLIKEFVAEEK